MRLKYGVSMDGMDSAMVIATFIADQVWREMGADELVVTSGSEGFLGDGVHSDESLHYAENSPNWQGRAADYRIWNLPNGKADAEQAASLLREKIGDQYDVIVESTHIHCEFDPD